MTVLVCAATELTGKRVRSRLSILSQLFYPLGYAICLLVAFASRDYFVIELIITLPLVLLLAFYLCARVIYCRMILIYEY